MIIIVKTVSWNKLRVITNWKQKSFLNWTIAFKTFKTFFLVKFHRSRFERSNINRNRRFRFEIPVERHEIRYTSNANRSHKVLTLYVHANRGNPRENTEFLSSTHCRRTRTIIIIGDEKNNKKKLLGSGHRWIVPRVLFRSFPEHAANVSSSPSASIFIRPSAPLTGTSFPFCGSYQRVVIFLFLSLFVIFYDI